MIDNTSFEALRQKVIPVLRRHNVTHAVIFGSLAKGSPDKHSDLDILVEFEGEKSLLDLVALKLDLREILGKEVDVLTPNALHPRIREAALQAQIVIL